MERVHYIVVVFTLSKYAIYIPDVVARVSNSSSEKGSHVGTAFQSPLSRHVIKF